MSGSANIDIENNENTAVNACADISEDAAVDIDVTGRLSHQEALAEALLFASGSSVHVDDIALVLKIRSAEVPKVIARLAEHYKAHNSGLVIKQIRDSYQLASRPDFRDELKVHFEQVTGAPLSRAALEALTIIAYNQPITRGGVEIIRGVSSDSVMSTLLERGLIAEVGKSESPGRPVLYGTTDLFLKSAGISSTEELKKLQEYSKIISQPGSEPADGND